MENLKPRVFAQISLSAIRHNYREIKSLLHKDTKIVAVIKADGYGHGAVKLAKIYEEEGVDSFAVATVSEGIELRKNGVHLPILVLGYAPKLDVKALIQNNLIATVFSYEAAEYLSQEAERQQKNVQIHLKMDTGMGRIGFKNTAQSLQEILKISKLNNIQIKGAFTHFSTADEESTEYTKKQWQDFTSFIAKVEEAGIKLSDVHAANSAAIMCHPYTHLNMVRPGIILYGFYPSKFLQGKVINLQPAMTLKSQIVHIKELDEGEYIGYGRKYCTKGKSKIATIPVGYADGYSRRLSNKGHVLIRGKFAPIVGNICMDQLMVDVTDIEGVALEDEVVLYGKQKDNCISIEEIADELETITYEIVCLVGKRVPRIYVD